MLKASRAVAAVTALLLTARPADADTLLTGAIRDRAGGAIAGARVTAFDAAGQTVGADVSLADGTFALDARTVPATIAIVCDYCRSQRRPVRPGEPAVVFVERFAALTAAGPSAADIRALPYRSAADIASLRPFAVIGGGRITDRGLDRDAAVLVDGLPFYRAADGQDLSQLVPAGFVAALAMASPLVAPRYGGYAAAGIADVRLRDPDFSTSRIDIGEAADVVVRADAANGGAGYAVSSDSHNDRQAASTGGTLPFAGGRLSFEGLGMSDSSLHASGAGLAYITDSRRFTTTGSLSATQSDAASLIAVNARVQNRGPLGWEFGGRMLRATSSALAAGGTQFDGAVYAAAVRQTGNSRVWATFAWDTGGDGGVGDGLRTSGLVGSLADDVRLGARWTFHAGAVSNLRIPTFAELTANAPVAIGGDRSLLFEQSLTYEDLRRFRVSGRTYTQRATGSATRHINGVGIEAAWQIAPQLALRTWLLRANQSAIPASYEEALTDAGPVPTASALTRQLIWLSYENHVRVDALVRGGALEGDVCIPLSARYAFAIRTAQFDGRRVTTFGVTRR